MGEMTGGPVPEGLLPWRAPLVMVDGMEECIPHERISTWKRIAADEGSVRAGPGAGNLLGGGMLLEGLSQSAALLFQASYGPLADGRVPLLGHLEAKLHARPRAGDTVRFVVRAVKMTSTHGLFHGTAQVGETVLAESELAFAVADTL